MLREIAQVTLHVFAEVQAFGHLYQALPILNMQPEIAKIKFCKIEKVNIS